MSRQTTRLIYILLLVLAFILLIIFYPSPADARPKFEDRVEYRATACFETFELIQAGILKGRFKGY